MSLEDSGPAASGSPVVGRAVATIAPGDERGSPEVSVVIPCLNEAETLGTCIEKAAALACASTASPARSSSPTTAAPTVRRTIAAALGAACRRTSQRRATATR